MCIWEFAMNLFKNIILNLKQLQFSSSLHYLDDRHNVGSENLNIPESWGETEKDREYSRNQRVEILMECDKYYGDLSNLMFF